VNERTVFLLALDQPEGDERAAYLDDACAGDPALRQRVEALLRSHAQANDFLAVPATERYVRQRQEWTEAMDTSSATLPRPGDDSGARTTVTAADEEMWFFLGPPRDAGALGWLDHYAVLEKVGRGGMGIVFKARDTKLQRIVAIKVLAPELAAHAVARQRFVREAQAAAAVRDDHVITIHAVNDDHAVPYLVMEFIAGITLDDCIQHGGPLEIAEILRIGVQTAKGLTAAHAQGLVHRDIKPANILLENGVHRVKITDFGLARSANNPHLTHVGAIAGSPMYMSPEQARGDKVDHRTDLFSLGTVLYVLCTGQAPFQAENTLAVLKRVDEDRPRPIRELNARIPAWLAAIVDKLQAKDPAQRFQTAAAVAELLANHLAHLRQAPPPGPPTVPGRLSRRRVGVAVLAAVLPVLLGVGYLIRSAIVDEASPQRQPVVQTKASPKQDPGVQTKATPQRQPLVEMDDPSVKAVTWRGNGVKSVFADPAHALEDVLDFRDIAGVEMPRLLAWLAQLGSDFRLSLLTCRRGSGPALFNAVAVREKTPRLVRFELEVTKETQQPDWDRNTQDGYRPLSICTYVPAEPKPFWTQTRLWVKDQVRQYTWNASLDVIRKCGESSKDKGCRTIFLDGRPELQGSPYQSMDAEDPGRRAWEPYYALTPQALLAAVESWRGRSWRPDVLAPYWDHDRLRFMLIVVDNFDRVDWRFRMDMTLEEYRKESARQKQQGHFPLALASYGHEADLQFAAIFVRYGPPQPD
jgi:serine/threonine protein kinase